MELRDLHASASRVLCVIKGVCSPPLDPQVGSLARYKEAEENGGESDLQTVISQVTSWDYFVLSPVSIIDVYPNAHNLFWQKKNIKTISGNES